MKKLFRNLLVAGLLVMFGFVTTVSALPTPKDTKVEWTMPNVSSDIAGFYLYWLAQASEQPYVFTDDNREQISDPSAREAIIIDVNPLASGGLCFGVTAYDTSGNESDFGTPIFPEVNTCGNFGIIPPFDVRVD